MGNQGKLEYDMTYTKDEANNLYVTRTGALNHPFLFFLFPFGRDSRHVAATDTL